MTRIPKAETVAVAYLGIALFALAVVLRQAQPGLLELPLYAAPGAAAATYAVVCILLAGLTARAAILFGASVVLHVLYGMLMGVGFATTGASHDGSALALLQSGLCDYPPAALLQIAFVTPAVGALLWPAIRPADETRAGAATALTGAATPEELLAAVLAVDAAGELSPEQSLPLIATNARRVLGLPCENEPQPDGTPQTEVRQEAEDDAKAQ